MIPQRHFYSVQFFYKKNVRLSMFYLVNAKNTVYRQPDHFMWYRDVSIVSCAQLLKILKEPL